MNRKFFVWLMPSLTVAIVGPIAVGALLGIVPLYLFSPSRENVPSSQEIPNDVILERAAGLPEVNVFLTLYPDPYIAVDRVDDFAVSYYVKQCELNSETCPQTTSGLENYLALHVRLDGNGYPQSIDAYCLDQSGGLEITDNVLGYLTNQDCFDSMA